MSDPKPTRIPRPSGEARSPDTAIPLRPARRDVEFRAVHSARVEEAERIMGVMPIPGLSGPRPGY